MYSIELPDKEVALCAERALEVRRLPEDVGLDQRLAQPHAARAARLVFQV